MKDIIELSFEIISYAGTSRSNFVEAIQAAKEGNFEQADTLMKEGNDALTHGHSIHADIVSAEASGNHVEYNVIFMHAEDIMMSAEIIEIMAKEFIALIKKGA